MTFYLKVGGAQMCVTCLFDKTNAGTIERSAFAALMMCDLVESFVKDDISFLPDVEELVKMTTAPELVVTAVRMVRMLIEALAVFTMPPGAGDEDATGRAQAFFTSLVKEIEATRARLLSAANN